MPRFLTAWVALSTVMLLATGCSGSTPAPAPHSPTPLSGALSDGLIAYVGDQGISVLDPSTAKSIIVAPLPPGAFRVAGPVWGPAHGIDHPVLYFTVHDDRPAESRNTSGVVPYDWLFRVDPFDGTIEPIAASQDSQSEGPIGLVANSRYLGLTVGCCTTYEVDALDLTKADGPLRVLAKPPTQPAFFTEGAAPGQSGLFAVRAFGTGAWYWLNADAGVLNPFPLSLGQDDGPIAISADGTMAAIAMPDHGAVVEPINSSLPIASPSATGSGSPAPASPTAHASPTSTAPKRINSSLPHPDALAWGPDGKELAIAVNGEVQVYNPAAADGTPPLHRFAAGANIIGVAWSDAMPDRSLASVKPSAGPQQIVDALLAATRLPAAADTPQNRPFTKIYVWQFDSTKVSPISAITDATPDVLAKYAPLNAGVIIHHWAAIDTWALLGGCYRYRVVVTGSVPATASTVSLTGDALCSAKPLATPSPSPSSSPS